MSITNVEAFSIKVLGVQKLFTSYITTTYSYQANLPLSFSIFVHNLIAILT